MRILIQPSTRSFSLVHHRLLHFITKHRMLLTVLILTMALLATALMGGRIATAANASFADKQDFATGLGPRSLAAGDLNGDGKLDLITVNVNTNTVRAPEYH